MCVLCGLHSRGLYFFGGFCLYWTETVTVDRKWGEREGYDMQQRLQPCYQGAPQLHFLKLKGSPLLTLCERHQATD